MAGEKVIAAKVKVDTDEAQKNVLKLQGNVDDLRKAFKKAEAGSQEQLDALKKLTAAEQELAEAQTKLAESNEKNLGAFSKIKGSLKELPGAAGEASKGVSALSGTFKALLANPVVLVITAIVGALTLLYKAFTATDEGAQKVQSVMDGLGSVVRELADRILSFGSAILKFFTGDFKGAIEDGTKAVSGFGDAMVDSFNRGKEASDLLDEVADAVRVLDVQYAALNAKLAKSKEILTDENATFEEKRKALKESGEEIDKYYKKKAEIDEKELTAIAKKYNIEAKLNELRKQGFVEGAEAFDNFLQTLAIGEDGIKEIEGAIKKSIESTQELSAKQRQQNKSETTLQRQEEAKLKEERQKAAEEEKKRKEELAAFTNKLLKLQQDNELALIKDGYQKDLKALDNRIADEKRQNELSFKDKKINQEQLIQLNKALDIQENIQRAEINDKHQKEVKAKEEAFQKELADITSKTKIVGVKDANKAELIQLEIGYQEKLKQAIEKYKDDTIKLNQIKEALDAQFKAEKQAKEAKIKEEEDKKKLEADIAAQENIFNEQQSTLEQKKAALDAEQVIIQQAFDNKVLSEEDYNKKLEALSKNRKQIADLETDHRVKTYQILSSAANAFSDLIGKNTVAGKLAAIAATTINTYEAAWTIFKNASKNPASIPFPAYPYIQAGLAIVAGLKTVNDIVKVKTPGGSSGGTAPAASGLQAPAAPIAPTQSTTSLDQNTVNNIGNAAAGGVNAVRAYVVEEDSAAAAARAARLQGAAVLGG